MRLAGLQLRHEPIRFIEGAGCNKVVVGDNMQCGELLVRQRSHSETIGFNDDGV